MKIINADCLLAMKEMPDNSVDAICCDPPYGISFMGKKWDYDVPSVDIWKECLRVLKPGGYLLAFAGTRTQHRMAVNIEDAGFEIRDLIMYVYGSGFPKSLNIGKVMDKYLKTGNASWNGTGDSSNGALGYSKLQHNQGYRPADYSNKHQNKEEITEDLAKKWEGWGTALKPALEPITVARKPIEGNVAQNCLKWGVGGINIDGCRVGTNPGYKYRADANGTTFHGQQGERIKQTAEKKGSEFIESTLGRFPANLIHDGSDEVVGLFPQTKSGGGNKNSVNNQEDSFLGTGFGGTGTKTDWKIDSGSASRFFYCAKASKRERNRGCEDMEEKQTVGGGGGIGNYLDDVNSASGKYGSEKAPSKNNHPTVKPIALMEYLVKLVSKEGHTVLDPFMGSGSTGIACKKLGREFIGIEKENDYCKIAEARIGAVQTVQEKLYD